MFVPIIRRICIIASVLEADGVHLGNPFSEKKLDFGHKNSSPELVSY